MNEQPGRVRKEGLKPYLLLLLLLLLMVMALRKGRAAKLTKHETALYSYQNDFDAALCRTNVFFVRSA